MPRKSTNPNKTIYQLYREEMDLTRAEASEAMNDFISEDKLDKIERLGQTPYPEEVIEMAKCYKRPDLNNYYCHNECAIGKEFVPEIKVKDLAPVILEMVSNLNKINESKDELIDITADGEISEDEYEAFGLIQNNLNRMSMTIDSLQLWIQQAIANGNINEEKLEKIISKYVRVQTI